jgi:pimeloyl-ACP methyl ester carboxylesterase
LATWLWVGLGVVVGVPVALALFLTGLWVYLRLTYAQHLARIFTEKPLFIIPRGKPVEDAEDVRLRTADGLELRGCYLRTPAERRRGVILFGLEYGSNRWSCVPYCERLLAHGFDVFTFEPRGQGDSQIQPGYEPLQWTTLFEVEDMRAALAYLKGRPDADPRGVGFFGISKGASSGLFAAAADPYVRCCVTDGVFATFTTVVPYMQKWISIYSNQRWLYRAIPTWYYELVGRTCLGRLQRHRGFRCPDLEPVLAKLAPRPLLMIHGGGDTYIKPDMAQALFDRARQPKELWIVEGAKHNQAIQVAGDEYHRRICAFFEKHLTSADEPGRNGTPGGARATEHERRSLMTARGFFALFLFANFPMLFGRRPRT